MRKLLSIFMAAALFSSCKKADDGSTKLVYTIADHKVSTPYWGGGNRDCYLAAADGSSTFEPFCDGIEGFEYVAGSTYVVELIAIKINPPLQDGGDTRYVLNKIISKR
jgi:hypothetical protein